MTHTLNVKPAPGRTVPNPERGFEPLSAEGGPVPRTAYWLTRVRDGDVVEASPVAAPAEAAPVPVSPAPVSPAPVSPAKSASVATTRKAATAAAGKPTAPTAVKASAASEA